MAKSELEGEYRRLYLACGWSAKNPSEAQLLTRERDRPRRLDLRAVLFGTNHPIHTPSELAVHRETYERHLAWKRANFPKPPTLLERGARLESIIGVDFGEEPEAC